MDNIFEIKPEFKSTVVGFNRSGLPLGSRNDLDKLALMAHVNKGLAKYFVRLPSLDEIKAYKESKFMAAHPSAEEQEPDTEEPTAPEEEVTEEEPAPPAPKKNRNRKAADKTNESN